MKQPFSVEREKFKLNLRNVAAVFFKYKNIFCSLNESCMKLLVDKELKYNRRYLELLLKNVLVESERHLSCKWLFSIDFFLQKCILIQSQCR